MCYQQNSTLIIYIGLSILLYIAIKYEYLDIYCPNRSSPVCGRGMGSMYVKGKPNSLDDIITLLEKIKISSRYEKNSVKWRRSFILSLISTILIFLILFHRLPDGKETLITLAILYFLFYISLDFFQHYVTKYAIKQIDLAISLLKDKLNLFTN